MTDNKRYIILDPRHDTVVVSVNETRYHQQLLKWGDRKAIMDVANYLRDGGLPGVYLSGRSLSPHLFMDRKKRYYEVTMLAVGLPASTSAIIERFDGYDEDAERLLVDGKKFNVRSIREPLRNRFRLEDSSMIGAASPIDLTIITEERFQEALGNNQQVAQSNL